MISRAAVLALTATAFSFAALADSASKFLGNTTSVYLSEFGVIPEDFGAYWNQITPQTSTIGHIATMSTTGQRRIMHILRSARCCGGPTIPHG